MLTVKLLPPGGGGGDIGKTCEALGGPQIRSAFCALRRGVCAVRDVITPPSGFLHTQHVRTHGHHWSTLFLDEELH